MVALLRQAHQKENYLKTIKTEKLLGMSRNGRMNSFLGCDVLEAENSSVEILYLFHQDDTS
jgi:hypothetical protein